MGATPRKFEAITGLYALRCPGPHARYTDAGSKHRGRNVSENYKLHRAGDWLLEFLVINEEYLVNASHQLALITSLPFVHTARRSYRFEWCGEPFGPVRRKVE